MKPNDIFTLAVRLLGLVFLYQGLNGVPGVLGMFWGTARGIDGTIEPIFGLLLQVGWPLLVARYLLRYNSARVSLTESRDRQSETLEENGSPLNPEA